MRKQRSAVSPSSSRRENPPENNIHAKTIGCMSGILHLISASHNRRSRRFLTFGNTKKHTKSHASSVTTVTAGEKPKEQNIADIAAGRNSRSQCEVPRSPTLPAEIRRSSPTKPQSPPPEIRSPALVARLMGLEAVPADSPTESVAEKRQRLLGALQRCDEDLKALKKIIEAVRSTDPPPAKSPEVSPPVADEFSDHGIGAVSEVKCSAFNGDQQQPSPVSVLDEFTRSPLSPSCHLGRNSFGRTQQQKQQHQVKKPPGVEEISSTYIYERITSSESLLLSSSSVHNYKKKKVNEGVDDDDDDDDDDAVIIMRSSKGMMMKSTVEEVCRDIAWGEKREVGRIGLALQDSICRDLIEEIVRDFLASYSCFYSSLPFQACKRRLCF